MIIIIITDLPVMVNLPSYNEFDPHRQIRPSNSSSYLRCLSFS